MVDAQGLSLAYTLILSPLEIMAKVKITQVKSQIDRPKRQKETLKILGLRKMHQTVVHEATPQILGMIKRVEHLVRVEEV